MEEILSFQGRSQIPFCFPEDGGVHQHPLLSLTASGTAQETTQGSTHQSEAGVCREQMPRNNPVTVLCCQVLSHERVCCPVSMIRYNSSNSDANAQFKKKKKRQKENIAIPKIIK